MIRCVEDEKGAKFAAKTIRKTQKGQNIVDEIEMEMRALNVCEEVSTVVNLHAVYMTSRDYTFILDYLPSDLHSEVEVILTSLDSRAQKRCRKPDRWKKKKLFRSLEISLKRLNFSTINKLFI